MTKGKEITVLVPERFCAWCQAYLGRHLLTGQWVIVAKPGCSSCKGTGDHYYSMRGEMTLTRHVIGRIV